MSNVTAEWLKFEKDGATLGYCGPELQTFAGGYTIYHPFTRSKNVCILEMTDKTDGVYTCTTKFPDVTDSFTSTNNVTLTTSTDDKSETIIIVLGSVLGLFIVGIILIVCLIILFVKQCKKNHAPMPNEAQVNLIAGDGHDPGQL